MAQIVKRKILYIHHGSEMGGAPRSLLYLIQGLTSSYRAIVCCVKDGDAAQRFRDQGIETLIRPGIETFNHTTAGWYPLHNPQALLSLLIHLLRFLPSVLRTRDVVREVQPDLVHLNSLVLLPSALGVKWAGVPLVWHVRESVARGHLGIRRAILRWCVQKLADEIVFICEDNRRELGVHDKGVVVYNFVDFRRFDRRIPGGLIRQEMGLASEDKVVLFLGGMNKIKGVLPLLEALHRVRRSMPQMRCLVCNSFTAPQTWRARMVRRLLRLVGAKTFSQKIEAVRQRHKMDRYVQLLPFYTDVEKLIAASDLVVVPKVEPHFARPVIEAGAMARPVVASRIGGVEEVVQDRITGILVPPNDPQALAEAIEAVLADEELSAAMGEAGYQQARQLFCAEKNVQQTMTVYEKLLGESEEIGTSEELTRWNT